MAMLTLDKLQAALQVRQLPTVTMWNRLEGRPRTADFDRALRAEVRDALWMLTRQWQLGEFMGDDAGSPLNAQVEIVTSHLDKTTIAAATTPYSDDFPLEASVESQKIAFVRGTSKIQLDLRVQLGRQWNKLLGTKALLGYVPAYRAKYRFALPPDDRSTAAADVYGHVQARQQLAAIAGRCTDGGELYQHLKAPGGRASDGIALQNPADAAVLDALGTRLVAWFDALYMQPSGATPWEPSRLTYRFSCGAPAGNGEKTLVADAYPGGHLDWHSFDVAADTSLVHRIVDAGSPPPGPRIDTRPHLEVRARPSFTKSLIPAPLTFDGMPNTRWWKFEDGKVSFGDISPATTDLAKLLMIEFALVYANDWFLIPFTLPAGSLANVRAMVVTNSFNERFWIAPAGSGPENAWQDWRMFTLSTRNAVAADMTMFLAPAVPKIQDGEPLEEVYFLRDEMANLVWGVETKVPLVTGAARPGGEVGRETAHYYAPGEPAPAQPYHAPIYYQPIRSVPENWIPFLPVHVPGSQREVQLQRGSMMRISDGSNAKIAPATMTVREGLDKQPRQPLFIREEEIPRAGTRVTRAFQRTRWRDGRTFVWLAMSRETGRGEDRSRLAFDQIPSVPQGGAT